MNKRICFVTTGDVADIATAKRALGLSVPLADLGWTVHILMDNSDENHHRCALECDDRIQVHYFSGGSMRNERKAKDDLIRAIDPDFLYICAFVTRNIVGIFHRSKKLVEHSELLTSISDYRGLRRFFCYICEYYSILYSDALINASVYLQKLYNKRARRLLKGDLPMLYHPYAYNPNLIKVREIDYSCSKFAQFSGKVNFVYLGSIVRNYGVFTLLEAIKKLTEYSQNFNLLLFGKGRDYEEACDYVSSNHLQDVVYMPGYIAEEEISVYFSIASAFISPVNDTVQDWARCPSKIYLYLPYRRRIITCRIGEPYEVLKDEGRYYEPGNSESLCEQMRLVLSEDTSMNIDPKQHSWQTRALELSSFLERTFSSKKLDMHGNN